MVDVVASDHTRQDIQLPNDVASKAQESSVSHKKYICTTMFDVHKPLKNVLCQHTLSISGLMMKIP